MKKEFIKKAEKETFISKVYAWMCIALVVTALTALWAYNTPSVLYAIASSQLTFFGLIIAELLLVFWLSSSVMRLTLPTVVVAFMAYSVLNGLIMSMIFLIYTEASIFTTFFVTAATFGVMSFYGYTTKKDLTSMGNLLGMALIGLVIASLVNWFLKSPALYWITTYVGILIFVGLTAYDTQKIKEMNIIGNEGTDEDKKEAIMGALILYLDFINLFLLLLRVMGGRKS